MAFRAGSELCWVTWWPGLLPCCLCALVKGAVRPWPSHLIRNVTGIRMSCGTISSWPSRPHPLEFKPISTCSFHPPLSSALPLLLSPHCCRHLSYRTAVPRPGLLLRVESTAVMDTCYLLCPLFFLFTEPQFVFRGAKKLFNSSDNSMLVLN